MTEPRKNLSVLLAVTETSPVEKLWASLVERVAGAPADVVTLFVCDESWHRAASLPFTCEISRVSGTQMAFTRWRAEQIGRDAAGRVRQRLEQLAAGTELRLIFEFLGAAEAGQVSRLVQVERDLLIAPSALEGQPLFAELAPRHRQVLLVQIEDQDTRR